VATDGRKPARPTILDVAARAGVSPKTVARVVTGEAAVSPGLVTRVLAAIDELGYRHDLNASNLRRRDQRTRTIGLLLGAPHNPSTAAMQRAVEVAAAERRFAVFVAHLDHSGDGERDVVAAFARRRVDGLIILPASSDHAYLGRERRAGTAIVFVERPPEQLEVDAVVADDRAGAALAIGHLTAQGHQRVGILGTVACSAGRERCRGALDAAAAAGQPPDDAHVRLELGDDGEADRAAAGMLAGDRPPTALFAAGYNTTVGAVRALHRLGVQHRVALVGFDDFPLADVLEPAVSVVAHDQAAMGRLAAAELFRRIDGDRSGARRHVLPVRLLLRGSGELVAAKGSRPGTPSP
jgi:LacI family transcriptional regulator